MSTIAPPLSSRRPSVRVAIALVVASFLPASVFAVDIRPNNILTFTGDQGYHDVGCFGSTTIGTPNPDQMVTEGAGLTNFYAQAVCGVSRAGIAASFCGDEPPKRQAPVKGPAPKKTVKPGVTRHSFIAFGQRTYMVDGEGRTTWTYPHPTRDGYLLDDGSIVLTLSKGKRFSGGAVIEISSDGEEQLIWKGSQSEVNAAQPTDSGSFVITEAGPDPRLLEVDRSGKVLVEFPLHCQKANHHLQTRMARKLADGTYLVPHLLDFAVLNYSADGSVVSKLDTTVLGDTERNIHAWPFTAIRHGDGQTLVCCTNGNRVVDFDADGTVIWQLTNDDLPGPWLQDPCGGQVLPNGNIVIACYAGGRKDPRAPKLFEVTRSKKVVWKYADGQRAGIHHFQLLDTNGKKLAGEPRK